LGVLEVIRWMWTAWRQAVSDYAVGSDRRKFGSVAECYRLERALNARFGVGAPWRGWELEATE